MPITVELRTEFANHEPEERLVGIGLPGQLFGDLRFELLKWIDPWGDTVFNRGQCQALVAEITQAESIFRCDLTALRRLAERAALEPHAYLVFIGD